jgi:heptosyltransferase II
LMSAAVWLSCIPKRAGLDSNGRGFSYNIRAPINPAEPYHEAEIYLSVPQAMGIDTTGIRINLPILETARARVDALLAEYGITKPYLVINPTGGSNPGMMMDSKRYPTEYLAAIGNTLARELGTSLILIGGPADGQLVNQLHDKLNTPAQTFIGDLTFPEIGALAASAQLYIGNDTGLTHLAAASGAKTVMIMGPSDPKRYAPYTDNSLAVWKPVHLASGGVAASESSTWDWTRDGIQPDEVLAAIRVFIASAKSPEKS